MVPKCNFFKCIFCQQAKKKGEMATFRLSEIDTAKMLLAFCNERQDEVFVGLSACTDVNNIFTADVLYHKTCFLEYRYDREKRSSNHDNKSNRDELKIDNRLRINLLVSHHGESFLFSHSTDRSKSSVVFKTCFKPCYFHSRYSWLT